MTSGWRVNVDVACVVAGAVVAARSGEARVAMSVSTPRKQFVTGCVIVSMILAMCPLAAPASSGFALRGIKGLWWEGMEKYRLALPWVAQHHMNFLMFCYSSFPASGKDWRADYSAEEEA